MELKLATKNDYKEVFDLYNKSFPKYERKPKIMLKRKFDSGSYDLFILRDNNTLAGFVITVPVEELNITMIDYLAVNTELRSKGYGSFILNEVVKFYEGKKIFLAMEEVTENAPNYSQRLKRLAFYKKNGWKNTGLLTSGKSDTMHVLAFSPISAEEYMQTQTKALGKVLMKLGKMNVSYHKELDEFS